MFTESKIPEVPMYTGKTLFAQIMDFLPWSTFSRIVDRYGGDLRVRTLRCAEQFRIISFAQLTYRESLRDIEACLSAQAAKLYHMGLRGPVSRSTLADANESRDWRIYADFAQRLIAQARKLYAGESFGVDISNTAYALDAPTIDLCLSMFPWAPFRTAKAAVKVHTLMDLRGSIPSFIHISDGKLHDVNVLDLLIPEAGAFYVMDRAYLDFERLYVLHQANSFFVTRAKSNLDARRLYSASTDRTVLQMDQATSSYKAFLRRFRKCRQITNLDRRFRLCSYRYHQEKAQSRCFALYIVTDPIGHHLRENALAASLSRKWNSIKYYGKS